MLLARIWRGTAQGRFETYGVPRHRSQTILDVVTYVQRRLDASLAYRFACRVGMCGSCAMTVNGVPRWTCRTHVANVVDGDTLEIAPLAHLPIVRDLVTDMRVFFDKWTRAKGRFSGDRTRADEFAVVKPDSPSRISANAGIECIGCGVCHSACDVVTWNKDYLGPAPLNRAWTLVNDARDAAVPERLQAVAARGGCHACHTHQSCQAHCPNALNPTASIAGLKRRTVQAWFEGKIER